MLDKTCAERLPAHLAGRLDDLRAMLARDEPPEGDDDLPGLDEYALSMDVRYSVRIDLSTGGPADYITADLDASGDVLNAQYHFADWFDHASKDLAYGDLETIESYIAYMIDGDPAAFIR